MQSGRFRDARRTQNSFLGPLEKRILCWLARHIPGRVTSDHLTALGAAGMLGAGFFYCFSRWDPLFLHGVNLCLILNWFGDSMDGTLARQRDKLRPRYGFYVDHILDTFGVLFLVVGLALSGYMNLQIALALLIAYFMLSINIYLATYTLGTFQMSFWKFGATELRLLLGIGNVVLIYHPHTRIAGEIFRLYDLGALVAIAGMLLTLVFSTVRHTRTLYRLERV